MVIPEYSDFWYSGWLSPEQISEETKAETCTLPQQHAILLLPHFIAFVSQPASQPAKR
jgi:hypothetical protein